MNIVLVMLLLLPATITFGQNIHLSEFQERPDRKMGEKTISFFLSPIDLTQWLEANANGDTKTVDKLSKEFPENLWAYGVLLRGSTGNYSAENIGIFRLNGHEYVEISSGSVKIDTKRKMINIALRTEHNGKTQDFEGNGNYILDGKKGISLDEKARK